MSRPTKCLSIRSIRIQSVPGSDSKSMHVKTRIINGEKSVEIKALINSGAQGNFMDEEFAKKHRILIVRLKKEIRVSNVDKSPNKSGPIRFETRLPTKIDGKTISTPYLISDIGKEDIILGLPWLERVNPEVDWITKSIKIIPKRMKPMNISQAFDREIQICKVETERKRMNSKKAFADQLRSLPDRRIRKKKSTVSIEEIPDEDATPKFERLSNNEESILIAVNELPDEYEEMLALVPDTEDDEEDEIEGDLV
jgi:hypothetical protein